jgi:hypothetical protein
MSDVFAFITLYRLLRLPSCNADRDAGSRRIQKICKAQSHTGLNHDANGKASATSALLTVLSLQSQTQWNGRASGQGAVSPQATETGN